MQNSLSKVLETLRLKSQSEFEKGEYFEKLVKIFLENDTLQGQSYDKVWLFKDWAKEQGYKANDTGIDLVARHSDGSGFCAIQCKFYASDHSIKKADIDSFVAAASTKDFVSLVLVDTTLKNLSPNLQAMLDSLEKPNYRIALSDLEKSRVDWATYFRNESVALLEKKTLRDHQKDALEAVRAGLAQIDRGKMIMACGTGKTFTALKIAEDLAGKGKLVLYMVPSLALMSQTVREWKNDCGDDFLAYSVCSDTKVGKRQADGDAIQFTIHDLAFPATTDAGKIADQVVNSDDDKMVVVFSTYQSIQVLSDAQKIHDLPEFDLIICDEAHRTTGATLSSEDESNFVRIHSNDHVAGKKRLYMTATPKVFGDNAKSKAKQHEITLASMDDEEKFGKVLFYLSFSWAIENNLLSDYKVIVLAVDEGLISAGIQNRLADDNEMRLDDATKIIGCYKALTKQNLIGEDNDNPRPMKRALAFCQNIAKSKMVTGEFSEVVDEFTATEGATPERPSLEIQTRHVDGTDNAKTREDCLDWLKADTDGDICRILTNARCLSEGVDVPSLDAIMFMHPRKSQIDVVQSVGRVMRKAPGKDMGYVILPVAIPAGVSPEEALKDNERYKVVWQILNAIRSHDDRFDALVNQIGLGEDISSKIEIIGLTAVVEDIKTTNSKPEKRTGYGEGDGGPSDDELVIERDVTTQGAFVFDELTQAIRAKIVEKCGTREFWQDWAKDIAKIAETHITRITTIVAKEGSDERKSFLAFLYEIRDDLNPEISETDAIEMLAQHLITKPVFDTLFEDNEFTKNNPVSRAMETVLDQLDHYNLGKEATSLQKFYKSVQLKAKDIKTAQGRQTLVLQLYDTFFQKAFPTLRQKLGIVYTPVEVVDFIIHSVNDVLKSEFGQTLGSKGVHILDPFTGTGTFITRLLQSGLIAPDELEHKYKHEIHANEIVLLAYYIAAINIEAVYHDMAPKDAPYTPFDGIVLTDTFQLYEQEKDMIADLLPDNSERRTAQKAQNIRVIIGNPPYSAKQKEASEGTARTEYPNLDELIAKTYGARSTATLQNALYDSYIRAIRWASDRMESTGVLAFVTGSSWIEKSFADGLRYCLAQEFCSLYILNLRGDVRKDILGKGMYKEGENIFDAGSMTGISICILVKNPTRSSHKQIQYFDIGDNLSGLEKRRILSVNKSISTLISNREFVTIKPDKANDWVNQTDPRFETHIKMGDKKDKKALQIFRNYTNGVKTQRDTWCYNASVKQLEEKIGAFIKFYNSEVIRYERQEIKPKTDIFIETNPKLTNWTRALKWDLEKGKKALFDETKIRTATYRPFHKQKLYYCKQLNEIIGQIPKIFPFENTKNRLVCVSGIGSQRGISVFMCDTTPDLQLIQNGQFFPLYLYENTQADEGLFATGDTGMTQRDGIADAGLAHFHAAYPGEVISKEDLFYYIYGLLHCPEYRVRYRNNLMKQLPRIPAVKKAADFWAFSKAGRALGDLHVNYETVAPYPVVIKEGDLRTAVFEDAKAYYRVEKMKFGGKGKDKDQTTVIYNGHITMTDIPLRAYEYVVNGKPALSWVMERQCVKVDKASGIVNDANDYANETVGNPAYPLELFQRVITVSLETLDIVDGLPELDID